MKTETKDRLSVIAVVTLIVVFVSFAVALIYRTVTEDRNARVEAESRNSGSLLSQVEVPWVDKWAPKPKVFLLEVGDQKVIVGIYRDTIALCPVSTTRREVSQKSEN